MNFEPKQVTCNDFGVLEELIRVYITWLRDYHNDYDSDYGEEDPHRVNVPAKASLS